MHLLLVISNQMQKKIRERAGKEENILTEDQYCAIHMNLISGVSLIFFPEPVRKIY